MKKGRRIYPDDRLRLIFKEGDYGYCPRSGCWMGRPPRANAGSFSQHTVTEHDDGTITVAPSIVLSEMGESGKLEEVWHGYLERGVWREI